MSDIIVKIKSILKQYSFAHGTSQDDGWDQFYQAFETKFRGDPEAIKKRLLERYFERIKSIYESSPEFQNGKYIDLGCGRGEMLEVLHKVGARPFGVDSSQEACARARRLGHQVIQTGSLDYVSEQTSESIVFVSCLHMVEHCEPEYNWQLLRAIYRTLRPGGALLIETPSLFSLWASQRQFYLDPTHARPVHPDLLRFTCEYLRFSHVEVLQFDVVDCPERAYFKKVVASKAAAEFKKLEDWLYGPMDVAIWAVK